MKELKPKISGIGVKQSQFNHCLPVPGNKPIRGVTTAIAALQPQIQAQEGQQGKMGWERLTAQARQINQLAAQLEQAMFEFIAIASEVNCKRRVTQGNKKQIKSVCEYLKVSVPCIKFKKSGGFVLKAKIIDLFRAEQEASQVAHDLRRQASRKEVLPLSLRNQRRVKG